jgi:ribosomal protein L28
MTARLSTQNLQFTSFTSFTQNTVSFSQRSTQNEDDDETKRTWDMNLQYDEEEVDE